MEPAYGTNYQVSSPTLFFEAIFEKLLLWDSKWVISFCLNGDDKSSDWKDSLE